MTRIGAAVLLVSGALLPLAGCGSGTSTAPTAVPSSAQAFGVGAFIASANGIQTPAIPGTLHTGAVATPSGGPGNSSTGPSSIVQSGGNEFTIQSNTPFTQVLISIGNVSPAVSGFWELDLPAASTSLVVLLTFTGGLPSTPFDLEFQVASGAAVGPASAVTTTVTTNFTTVPPSVIATYAPNPAPFLGGIACQLSSQQGCLWEFKVLMQEFNGIGVQSATYNETYTFAASTITNSLPTAIEPRGFTTVIRSLSCGVLGTVCATPDQLLGGSYTFTVTGSDANGNPFNFTGPVLMLGASGQ